VTIGAVADRTTRDPTEADRVQLEVLALLVALGVAAGVHEVRRRREARSVEQLGRLLAEQTAEQIEQAPDAVVARVQCGRELRLPERAIRDDDVDQ
jgi:hypothetical protein